MVKRTRRGISGKQPPLSVKSKEPEQREDHENEATTVNSNKKRITPVKCASHTPTRSSPRGQYTPRHAPSSPSSSVEEDKLKKVGLPSPRSVRKWTLDNERVLCELWEEEDHLYDTTSKDYRNSNKRQRALLRLAAVLNMEGRKFIKFIIY